MITNVRFWDDTAERYARRPWPDPESTKRKLAVVRARMGSHARILDIGCGTGSIALELAASAKQVCGLDISGEMVRIARQKAAANDVSNVEFQQGSVEEGLDAFEEGTFDVVTAFNIVHLARDSTRLLGRVFQMLRPGGHFVSSTPCLGNTWLPYRPLLAALRWMGKAPEVEILSSERLVQRVQDVGFTDLEQPDVGASKTVLFLLARRPSLSTPSEAGGEGL